MKRVYLYIFLGVAVFAGMGYTSKYMEIKTNCMLDSNFRDKNIGVCLAHNVNPQTYKE